MTTAGLRPSPLTALVLVVRLPPALEALRWRSIADVPAGVPAHVTLLWPFAEEGSLDADVLDTVTRIVARHAPLDLVLGEGRRFPDTLYASVEPDAPLRALQAELAAAFPTLPLYGGEHTFVPHVSVVEGAAATMPEAFADPAWAELPVRHHAGAVGLITRRNGTWGSRHQFPLGGLGG